MAQSFYTEVDVKTWPVVGTRDGLLDSQNRGDRCLLEPRELVICHQEFFDVSKDRHSVAQDIGDLNLGSASALLRQAHRNARFLSTPGNCALVRRKFLASPSCGSSQCFASPSCASTCTCIWISSREKKRDRYPRSRKMVGPTATPNVRRPWPTQAGATCASKLRDRQGGPPHAGLSGGAGKTYLGSNADRRQPSPMARQRVTLSSGGGTTQPPAQRTARQPQSGIECTGRRWTYSSTARTVGKPRSRGTALASPPNVRVQRTAIGRAERSLLTAHWNDRLEIMRIGRNQVVGGG